MRTDALEQLSQAVDIFIREKGMDAHVGRKRIYKNRCYVVDFSYRGTTFAFDFIPVDSSTVSIDFVPRDHSQTSDTYNAEIRSGKRRVADETPCAVALELFASTLTRIEKLISKEELNASTKSAQATIVTATATTSKKALAVGVLTLPLSANFGNNLQAFALVDTLRHMGHRTVLINRRRPPDDYLDNDDAVTASLLRPLLAASIDPEQKYLPRVNAKFIDRYIGPSTHVFSSSRELSINVDRYALDAVIVGSDQVWRPNYASTLLSDFLLGFLDQASANTRRVSYAASFGSDRWEYTPELELEAAALLQKFDAVSVREDTAREMCRTHLGCDALHVLDPTMLVSPERYVELFSESIGPPAEDRLITYILDPTSDKSDLLTALSARMSLPIYSTSGRPYISADPLKERHSVERWLASIHGSKFVVTDSFHGMVFAIIFQKPFLVYANTGRGMARFTSMLNLLGLQERLVLDTSAVDVEQALRPIDWATVDNRLTEMRRQSMAFLERALIGSGAPGAVSSAAAQTGVSVRESTGHPLNVQCTGCGACISESRGALRMAWNADGFLEPTAQADVIPSEALRVCPFNPTPSPEVADEDTLGNLFLGNAQNYHSRAGYYERAYIGYSSAFRPSSSSGGLATYIFDKLLKLGVVDYLFVVRGDGGSGYSYAVFNGLEDIRAISKTRYFPVSLDRLFEVIENMKGRVAVSGVACFVKAIRLKQHYHPSLRSKIPFLIGIICGGLKSRHYTDFLAQSAGITGSWHDAEYRSKNPESSASDYYFEARDSNYDEHRVRMRTLGDMWGSGLFKSKACDFCTDVLTELADLSVGDAWLPNYVQDGSGNSVIVARTALADTLIQSGMASGELHIKQVPIRDIIESQRAALNHKQKGLRFRQFVTTHYTNLPVPYVRSRTMSNLSAGEMLLQVLRERVREKSLRVWSETNNVTLFSRRIRSARRILRDLTRIRKDHGRQIMELSEKAVEAPYARLACPPEVAPVSAMLRWLQRKVRRGEITEETLRSLLPPIG